MVGKADVGPKRSSGRIQWAIFAKPHSYMWFLIASEQITQTKKHNKSMTMDQLLEAEQRAAEWMSKDHEDSTFFKCRFSRRPT